MNRRWWNESAEFALLLSFLSSCPILLPHIISSLLTSSAKELTVGKVYAALMIFDYYKQNRTRRLQLQQQQQQSASGSQVQHPHHICLHTTNTPTCTETHTHWMQYCKPVCMCPHILCLHTLIHTLTVCLHVYTTGKKQFCIR